MQTVKKKRLKVVALAVIGAALNFFFVISSEAQAPRMSLSAGFANSEIIGDNIATKPFYIQNSSGEDIYGGSFDGGQPGFRVQLTLELDDAGILEIPLGFEYIFYMGREREPISDVSDIKLRHDLYLPSFSIGMNYSFLRFFALSRTAKVYAGIEGAATYVTEGTFERVINYVNLGDKEKFVDKTKPSTWRFGGTVRLGLNGELNHPWYIDVNGALGAINFLGKDGSRGELMTPNRKNVSYVETEETTVYNFRFWLMIQYKL